MSLGSYAFQPTAERGLVTPVFSITRVRNLKL